MVVAAALGLALMAAVEVGDRACGIFQLLPLLGCFALLGAFFGTIYVTDPRSGLTDTDRPILRAAVCALLGGSFALLLELQLLHSVVVVLGITGLGYLGMRWARWVDF
jgi:hypothetical protein